MKKIVIALLVIAGAATLVTLNMKRGKKGVEVEVQKIERKDITALVTCTGKIEAKKKVDISANVMGQIVNLAVKEGEAVELGQFLLQIDGAQLEAQTTGNRAALDALQADAEAARSNRRQAELDFERAKKNFTDEIIAEADYQRAQSTLNAARANVTALEQRIEQAKAALAGAKDNLSKTTIRSPISGTVTALPVEAGEIAVIGTMNNAGTKLMTISDMSVIEAHMQVDETDVPRVHLDQPARVTIDALPDQTFDGKVSEIAASPIVSQSGTGQAVEFEVKIVLISPPASVRPGFSVSAEIETGSRKNALALPIQALVTQDMATRIATAEAAREEASGAATPTPATRKKEQSGVFVITDGKAKFTEVKTGLQGELVLEVESGVEEGTEVITGPYRTLRQLKDGDLVRIKSDDDKKKKD